MNDTLSFKTVITFEVGRRRKGSGRKYTEASIISEIFYSLKKSDVNLAECQDLLRLGIR